MFRTCWFYRTTGLASLSAAALQLRILWASLRWDDMAAKSSAHDGKNQLTTDTEIVTTDVLRHRHVGRFLERTQYFQRRVVIPLDVPKTVREVAPSRSGLRKRKLVEAPRLSQPIVSEDWIDEDRLDLWEIRQYHERIERAASGVGTTPTMTRFKTAAAASPQTTAQVESLYLDTRKNPKLCLTCPSLCGRSGRFEDGPVDADDGGDEGKGRAAVAGATGRPPAEERRYAQRQRRSPGSARWQNGRRRR